MRKSFSPAWKAIKLSLSADVLADARAFGLDISRVCDAHLREVVRRERERRWSAEYAEFIAAYNRSIEAEGLPLERYRSF